MGHVRPRPKRLAEKLLQIREALGLSQRQMAERLGLEMRYNIISRYERDKSVPPIEVVLAYARAVGVQMALIVDDDLDRAAASLRAERRPRCRARGARATNRGCCLG